MGQVDSKYINSDSKPSEVTETPWLYEKNEEIEKTFNPGKDCGKWIMYFSVEEIDQKWAVARIAYSSNKLPGISDMKVKTAFKSESDPYDYSTTKVIIFYCGPDSEEEKMLTIGRNLVNVVPYTDKFGWIYYKSNRQTAQGSRKTGNKKNYLYKLSVPKKGDINEDMPMNTDRRNISNKSSPQHSHHSYDSFFDLEIDKIILQGLEQANEEESHKN